MNIIEKAARIAIIKHKDQRRKDEDFPYIIHPFMVANKLAQNGFSDEVIAAGLVHDVLEDSDTSRHNLAQELGENIVNIVSEVTHDDSLDWEAIKEKYAKSIENISMEAKAVIVSDKIHNAENIMEAHKRLGSDLWKKFNRGKDKKIWFEELVLQSLKKSWEHPLIDKYESLIEEMKKLD